MSLEQALLEIQEVNTRTVKHLNELIDKHYTPMVHLLKQDIQVLQDQLKVKEAIIKQLQQGTQPE